MRAQLLGEYADVVLCSPDVISGFVVPSFGKRAEGSNGRRLRGEELTVALCELLRSLGDELFEMFVVS